MTPDDCCVEDGGWFGDCGDILADVELLQFLFGGHFFYLFGYPGIGIDVVRSH